MTDDEFADLMEDWCRAGEKVVAAQEGLTAAQLCFWKQKRVKEAFERAVRAAEKMLADPRSM